MNLLQHRVSLLLNSRTSLLIRSLQVRTSTDDQDDSDNGEVIDQLKLIDCRRFDVRVKVAERRRESVGRCIEKCFLYLHRG